MHGTATVFTGNKHPTPNCKEYTISFDKNKQAYYSPSMKKKIYFIEEVFLRQYLDSLNPGTCRANIYDTLPEISNDSTTQRIAPNGRIYRISKIPQGYTSMDFSIIKYF